MLEMKHEEFVWGIINPHNRNHHIGFNFMKMEEKGDSYINNIRMEMKAMKLNQIGNSKKRVTPLKGKIGAIRSKN